MSLLSRLAVQAARAYGVLSAVDKNKVSADYLVVAGGGGAGDNLGGAGGAGGLLTSTATLSTLNTYSITVGAGGVGGASGDVNGSNGSNSVISGTGLTTITAIGGGGGAGNAAANSGGSGGGGSSSSGSTGGAGTSGQGNAGGTTPSGTYWQAASGGGGAGAAGTGRSSSASTGGNGGNGIQSSISGTATYYAGGGAGGAGTGFGTGTVGTAGLGGGGIGKLGDAGGKGGNGGVNLGGGGGGGGTAGGDGGDGGSGIVIISYTSATPKFVGGTLTTSGGNQIHTFTSSGTLSPITPITASYLVVAGGGGSAEIGGGGGAGGLLTGSTTIYSGASYIVTVGAGGAGTTGGSNGANGTNSVLSGTGLTTVTSTGGGGGSYYSGNGQNGGSGGGSGRTGGTVGTGISGQGNNGGLGGGGATATGGAGGGGGASAVGGAYTGTTSGSGGAGTASSISGTSITYAGGGGGGAYNGTAGSGGAGGGGNGASGLGNTGVSGTSNLGGGGGGGSASGGTGGSGGSGIVIISYAGSQAFNGGLVTSSGGNTIHTFTSTGALTPLTNNLTNSLRFRGSASAYLNRTPSVASNRKTWTWSAWVKKAPIQGSANTLATLMACTTGSTDSTYLRFGFYQDKFIVGNNSAFFLQSTSLYRDPSAWYHVVVSTDTNQGSASNRMRIYINGNEVTAWSTDQRATYLTSSVDLAFNQASQHSIGSSLPNAGDYFDGYMDDINFIDGQALEPYYFGNNDANGVWKPILYKGTYGTNGFYLTFGNTTSTTTLGYDSSPNGNNWTTNNISLTAGTTYDAMTDVPTNTSATVANYCTLNPLSTTSTLANGNLTYSNGATYCQGTQFPTSGLFYAEIVASGPFSSHGIAWGVIGATANMATTAQPGVATPTGAYLVYSGGGLLSVWSNTGSTNQTNPFTVGQTWQIALDVTTGYMYLGQNNTWYSPTMAATGNPSTGANPTFTLSNLSTSGGFSVLCGNNTAGGTFAWNFGQRPFTYTPPTGFVALNTFNLPTPTILQGNKYMDATLYTGNGSTQTITNASAFKPDLVWVKSRAGTSGNSYNLLYDSIRGAGIFLSSNTTGADTGNSGDLLSSFNSNGFSVNNTLLGGANPSANGSGTTFVGWQWQAGQGTNTTNTAGSITSTVSVNTTAGFSVVTFSNPTTGSTIGHGLGVAPKMMIVKDRGSVSNWQVYHASLGNNANLRLNLTDAQSTPSNLWNTTTPTSTVFTFGSGFAGSYSYVVYCWAEIAGFSKFGSYTGNGSADGTFVYLGFRPEFIMVKKTNTGNSWVIEDSSRSPFNVVDDYLVAEGSAAEATSSQVNIDFLSNGFKLRSAFDIVNAGDYIYMAFAEHPFKNSNAR
jgi:hypothetical protein